MDVLLLQDGREMTIVAANVPDADVAKIRELHGFDEVLKTFISNGINPNKKGMFSLLFQKVNGVDVFRTEPQDDMLDIPGWDVLYELMVEESVISDWQHLLIP